VKHSAGDGFSFRGSPQPRRLADFDPKQIRSNARSDLIWALFSHSVLGVVLGLMFLILAALDHIAGDH
jgi:hypothetical protein